MCKGVNIKIKNKYYNNNMNNKLEININFGISIILNYYNVFEHLIINKIFEYIYVSIDNNILKYYRNTTNNKIFNDYVIFLKYLNQFKNIIIENDYNEKYKNICVSELSRIYNIPIKYKIYDQLIINDYHLNFEYITISTKILGIPYSIFERYKNILFNKLNNINCKIIILGEKEVTKCIEYDIHETYSFYNDLINNLNNYIDMSIDNNTLNAELDPLLKTFKIYNKSKLNIFISNGGVSELMGYFTNNILGLTTKDNLLNIENFLNEDKSNIKLFKDFDNFINYFDIFFNNIKKKAILCFHQGYTDIINCLPLINYYSELYSDIYLIIRKDLSELINFYNKNLKNINSILICKNIIDNNNVIDYIKNNNIIKNIIDYELLFIGEGDLLNKDPYKNKFRYIDGCFVKGFYESYDIPYITRINYFNFDRDLELENIKYNEFINKYGENYILYHEVIEETITTNNLCVNLNGQSDIFFDYIKILENAIEFHLLDSVWGAFIYMLDCKYKLFHNKKIYLYVKRSGHRKMFEEPIKLDHWIII